MCSHEDSELILGCLKDRTIKFWWVAKMCMSHARAVTIWTSHFINLVPLHFNCAYCYPLMQEYTHRNSDELCRHGFASLCSAVVAAPQGACFKSWVLAKSTCALEVSYNDEAQRVHRAYCTRTAPWPVPRWIKCGVSGCGRDASFLGYLWAAIAIEESVFAPFWGRLWSSQYDDHQVVSGQGKCEISCARDRLEANIQVYEVRTENPLLLIHTCYTSIILQVVVCCCIIRNRTNLYLRGGHIAPTCHRLWLFV